MDTEPEDRNYMLALITENAADLFYSWLLDHGWREPQEHTPGVCQMCEFREAMIDAIKAGQ